MATMKFVTALGPNDPDDGDVGRQQRGLAIALLDHIRSDDFGWKVPSQSGKGSYFVSLPGQGQPKPYCSCDDFETRNVVCKHIYAVLAINKREEHLGESGVEVARIRIQQPWSLYNAAQENEGKMFRWLLRELCDTAQPLPQTMGRPRHPIGDMIYAMATKVYSMRSARRAKSDIRSAVEAGNMTVDPSTSAAIRMFGRPDVTPVLRRLIQVSALPLRDIETDFAVDSTGFSSTRYNRWFDRKYGGAHKRATWVKLHGICGVRTNIITAAFADQEYSADSKRLVSLLRETNENFTIREVTADKAYSTHAILQAISELGATPYIPFKTGSRAHKEGEKGYDPIWNRMYNLFAMNRAEFDRHYHPRNNVETAFHMMKAKFGDAVKSKTLTARINEALLKVICHNLCVLIGAMYSLGVDPSIAGARDHAMDVRTPAW